MNRTQIIKWFILSQNFHSYFEIGLGNGLNFDAIPVDRKVGIDPKSFDSNRITSASRISTHGMISDLFFELNQEKFDLIFIDGLHLHEQVIKDIENSLRCLNTNGIILMHDCLPRAEIEQRREINHGGAWTGDAWKAFAHFRATRSDLTMCTIPYDHGIGVVKPGEQTLYTGPRDTYEDHLNNLQEMMNPLDLTKERV